MKRSMRREFIVQTIIWLFVFFSHVSVASGASVGRNIMSGRTALLQGNPQAALPHFEAIARSNPNYVNCAEELCIGVWTYLGRTQHELGENQQAQESLKKGVGRDARDRFNKVYLGLVRAQTGQEKEGQVELDDGLKVLGDWLAGFAGRGSTGQFWDANGVLQRSIANIRGMLKTGPVDWNRVNQEIQSLSVEFEQEARDVRDEKDQRRRGRRRF
ncbi:MAG: hypothetical protein GTO40_08820 [Deltaproteobacteria bacterium]|nr:hypothetical protein [Deltaproteobacteria bacterium]